MDKALLIFALGFLLLAISVAYYFLAILPEQNRAATALENKQKCQEAGFELSDRQRQEAEAIAGVVFVDPEFTYNSELQTCFYKDTITSSSGVVDRFIKDVYANKEVVSWLTIEGKTMLGNQAEFDQAYQNLFLLSE